MQKWFTEETIQIHKKNSKLVNSVSFTLKQGLILFVFIKGELGLHIWKKVMVMPLKQQLVKNLVACIMIDRNGDSMITTCKPEMVRGCIDSFVALDQYRPQDNIQVSNVTFIT